MRANNGIDVPSSTGIATRVTIDSLFIMRPMPPFLLPRPLFLVYLPPADLLSPRVPTEPDPSSSPEIRRIFSTNNQTRTRHDYDRVRHAPSMIGSSIDIALSVNKRYIIFLFKRYTFYFTMTKYVFHARLIKRTLFHLEQALFRFVRGIFFNKIKDGITLCKYKVKFLDKVIRLGELD